MHLFELKELCNCNNNNININTHKLPYLVCRESSKCLLLLYYLNSVILMYDLYILLCREMSYLMYMVMNYCNTTVILYIYHNLLYRGKKVTDLRHSCKAWITCDFKSGCINLNKYCVFLVFDCFCCINIIINIIITLSIIWYTMYHIKNKITVILTLIISVTLVILFIYINYTMYSTKRRWIVMVIYVK